MGDQDAVMRAAYGLGRKLDDAGGRFAMSCSNGRSGVELTNSISSSATCTRSDASGV
jgi:hypothetical protein